ncbi:hypothetical protein DFH09DRAFT_1135131 [Mycena vulgaris]|nr:hypothetical protein DFH09DRAFT_1135131 [Mycena vulgaris]
MTTRTHARTHVYTTAYPHRPVRIASLVFFVVVQRQVLVEYLPLRIFSFFFSFSFLVHRHVHMHPPRKYICIHRARGRLIYPTPARPPIIFFPPFFRLGTAQFHFFTHFFFLLHYSLSFSPLPHCVYYCSRTNCHCTTTAYPHPPSTTPPHSARPPPRLPPRPRRVYIRLTWV